MRILHLYIYIYIIYFIYWFTCKFDVCNVGYCSERLEI